ncbi:hypothetical protein Q1695_003233 [Nippostrongylus brasiliensis]|nr:hypothetical protein Q1695_003233 [Nippostrongylus brasiliensis]
MDGEVQRQIRQNINAAGLGIRNIRSGAATVAVYVRFVNFTDVDVDVIWINEEGRGIRYGQLKKSQYLDISTYEGHPWIFRESGVGDVLIGQPGRIPVYFPKRENINVVSRVCVLITFPLMTLRDWAVRAVANFVEIAPYALLTLPLPTSQIKVVQSLLVHRLQYVSMFEPNPLVGRRLRATVRRYMNPSIPIPEPLPILGQVVRQSIEEDREQIEE